MRSELIAYEPNPYKRVAMLKVTKDIDFNYTKEFHSDRLAWLVYGKFKWNIDQALKRSRVDYSKDIIWFSAEMVDDECLADKDETEDLYLSLDRALVSRLFALNRIQRRLEASNASKN